MRLKRLELYGYKSFASRAVFEFSDGVTAIVGPNGSGKSNIADGIRWVLGEQSYTNLRGRRTEDMIFAGSRKRARLGMAEVTLTLDNADRWLDIDFTEVTIGRRAYRSGENEYLLNGSRVRYREIADLLGSAGVTASNYVVIGQGMVDAALALTPEARRSLFEEAAGIAPQLRKREETLQRIAETQRNLERAEDIIGELRPRARTLRRQAERAEEHLLLAQDLRELQRIWFGYQWQNSQQRVAQAEVLLVQAREALDAQRSYAREQQAHQDGLRSQIAGETERQDALSAQVATLREEHESVSRTLAISGERARLYAQQRASAEEDKQALLSRRSVLQDEVARAAAQLSELSARYQSCLTEISGLQAGLAAADRERQEVAEAIRSVEKEITARERQVAQRQAQAEQLSERRDELLRERDSVRTRTLEGTEKLSGMQAQYTRLHDREQALATEQRALEEQRESDDAALTLARESLVAAERIASEARDNRDQLNSRQKSLQRQREQMSDFHPGVREVLRAGHTLQGIRGPVATLMRVPAEYEQAIQSALGTRLENIVTERWSDAEAAIAFLKERHSGWATFLPLDTLRARPPIKAARTPGVVGVASELIRFDADLQPVFDLLLGHVLVVDNLRVARRLLSERSGASLLVTLEGDTAQPSGAVSGGARQVQTRVLAQEREWRELPAQLHSAEEALSSASHSVATAQSEIDRLQRTLREQASLLASKRQARDAAHQAAVRHSDEIARAERDQTWLTARSEQLEKDLVQLAERQSAVNASLGQLDTQGQALSDRLAALVERREAVQDAEDRQRLNALQTEAEVSQRTAKSVQALRDTHVRNLEQIDQQVAARSAQSAEHAARLADVQQQIVEGEAHLAELQARLDTARGELVPVQSRRAQLEVEEQEGARQLAASLERLHEAETEFNQSTLERDRAHDRQASLSLEIEESLGPIDLPDTVAHQLRLNLDDDVVELPRVMVLPSGLSDEIRQMRARLGRVGSINPEAPREYERLLERQTFLSSQISDLRGAIASLHEVIEELDQVIERDFGVAVRSVDERFREFFTELFGGGTARLVLTDPENLAASGVDIIAQPPGKHAQRLSLLSGGERALTAVALLFALLAANPVPFCILDEVDAALDESNVGRFRDMLRHRAQNTQYVVITHNRRTIEAAETIYGISMEDQGVSQCISLQVSESSAQPS
ncbi:MAG: chromosome segregation protein SMC [Anaerolineae bacterium]|jgi:chromosome segregation protein|nr:chromosome segregation protein SMC [Chloroflexota bacterium]